MRVQSESERSFDRNPDRASSRGFRVNPSGTPRGPTFARRHAPTSGGPLVWNQGSPSIFRSRSTCGAALAGGSLQQVSSSVINDSAAAS